MESCIEAYVTVGCIMAYLCSNLLLFMCVATLRILRGDLAQYDRQAFRAQYEEVTEQLTEDFDDAFGEQVDSRVDDRIDYRLARTRGIFNRQAVKDRVRREIRGQRRKRDGGGTTEN